MTPRALHRRRKKLLIYGASGYSLVVAEAAAAAGWHVGGWIDDAASAGQTLAALPVLRPLEAFAWQAEFIVAIEDNAVRRTVHRRLVAAGVTLANIIHPGAWLSPSSEVGKGVYVGAKAVINAQAHLGDGVIINTGALVEHHNQIGEFAHLSPYAALAGTVRIGALSLIGTGASVRPAITIGQRCKVCAGSAVVENVPDRWIVAGVPARRYRA